MADVTGYATAVLIFLLVLAVIYGAICDVTSFTIPNRVSYGILLLFLPYAALNWGQIPVLLHIGFGLFTLALCIGFWMLRWFGGGDAKFAGALAFWMGPAKILLFVLLLALTSILLIVILRFARQWNFFLQAGGAPKVLKTMVQKATENAIPYGLPAAVAALIALAA
jgi:prepilin peptidase CpaA